MIWLMMHSGTRFLLFLRKEIGCLLYYRNVILSPEPGSNTSNISGSSPCVHVLGRKVFLGYLTRTNAKFSKRTFSLGCEIVATTGNFFILSSELHWRWPGELSALQSRPASSKVCKHGSFCKDVAVLLQTGHSVDECHMVLLTLRPLQHLLQMRRDDDALFYWWTVLPGPSLRTPFL